MSQITFIAHRNDGWDRIVVRRSFVKFYRDLVLPNVDAIASTPRKVRTREQLRHRNPPLAPNDEQPRNRSGEKAAPTANLSNKRQGLTQYFAGLTATDTEPAVITHRDLIKKRYDDKLKWFNAHYVSYCLEMLQTRDKILISPHVSGSRIRGRDPAAARFGARD